MVLNRSRFLQTLHVDGFDEPVQTLYDFLNNAICGIQAGIVVNAPIPRGVLITRDPRVLLMSVSKPSEGAIPLELFNEQKWSYFNPLFAKMQREMDNAGDSKLIGRTNTLTDSLEFGIDATSTASRGATLALTTLAVAVAGRGVTTGGKRTLTFRVTYPLYLAIAPVGSRTVVVLSGYPVIAPAGRGTMTAVSGHTISGRSSQKPIQMNLATIIPDEGKSQTPVEFALPSNEVLTNLFGALAHASRIVTNHRSEVPTRSKIPELGPLLHNLAAYAASPSQSSWHQFQERTLQDRTEFLWKQDSGLKLNICEITGSPFGDLAAGSRYAPRTLKCPKCGSLRNVSLSTMRLGGMVRCHTCGLAFQNPYYNS